jgi:KDO2-lipid IV(A) lauroyltransferase
MVGDKPLGKYIKNTLVYWAAASGYKLAQALPRSFGLALFGAIGKLVFIFPNREKTRTIDHLRQVYGSKWTESKILRTASDVYSNLGKNLFDSIYLTNLPINKFNKFVKYESLDEVKMAFDKGKGLIAITAHVGCFEMLLHFFGMNGIKSIAIGRKMYDERLEQLVRKTRSGPNIEYISRADNLRPIIRWLQEGRCFGVLIDQDTNVEGVFADFLGKKAFTPSGPIKIAMKLDIPVFVITTGRNPDNTHQIFVSKQIGLEKTGNFDRDLVANVQKANDLICNTIEKFPSQWVWMHRRWKQQPQKNIDKNIEGVATP